MCLVTQLCLTLCDPWTVDHQAPLSMGFSRQEYWSGLPFPSPGDLPNPGIEPRSPAMQADSLPSEPPGKPKNIGVGSLTHLQGVFLTQELNWGLLHRKQILSQLSYQASTKTTPRQTVFQKSGPRMPSVPLWDRFRCPFWALLLPCLPVCSNCINSVPAHSGLQMGPANGELCQEA